MARFATLRYAPRPVFQAMNAADLIYLDNNATTRVDPAVVEEMMPYLTDFYGNPSSGYRFGAQVGKALELARERVAALLGCDPEEIVFTSCGTESTNAAINSALLMDRDRQHIVTTRVEHSATLKDCETLAKEDTKSPGWVSIRPASSTLGNSNARSVPIPPSFP